MSKYSDRTLAPRIASSNEVQTLISDIKSGIKRAVTAGTNRDALAQSIAALDTEPARRKAVAPVNRYNDNTTYVDHSPYKDGYADTYNDGRARLNNGS